MICGKCSEDLVLRNAKNPDTDMHFNYWYCYTCKKKIDPTNPWAFDMPEARELIESFSRTFDEHEAYKGTDFEES